MLAKSRADKRNAKEPKLSENSEAFMPDDSSVADSLSTWGVVNIDASDDVSPTDDLRVPSSTFPAICMSPLSFSSARYRTSTVSSV